MLWREALLPLLILTIIQFNGDSNSKHIHRKWHIFNYLLFQKLLRMKTAKNSQFHVCQIKSNVKVSKCLFVLLFKKVFFSVLRNLNQFSLTTIRKWLRTNINSMPVNWQESKR